MRSIARCKRHMARVFARAALLILASMLLAPMASAEGPSQAGVSWNYRLLGKLNSALNGAGQMIVITGSGSFDLSQASIDGGGGYTILDAEGSVVGSGTWSATRFDSYIPAGPGRSPGEGGRLDLEADFTGELSGPARHVVIQCSMWGPTVGPPGYPWPPDFVEVGTYNIHNTGAVMFNLNQ